MFVGDRNLSILAKGLLSAALVSMVACSPSKSTQTIYETRDNIFSNRQIGEIPDLYVVTLNAPALLEVAKPGPNGTLTIPEDAKQKVLAEQAQVEAKLKKLSPDIKIVYHYRMTLNGLAIFAPPDVAQTVMNITGVKSVSPSRVINRPQDLNSKPAQDDGSTVTSVSFIGADQAHQAGITGKGIRVGILDTGIDYTHKMLGGSGDPSAYKNDDPSKPNALFPNKKVVGGLDLVGTDFDAAAALPSKHLPQPDANPIDEAGHGTHVAGTIAGLADGHDGTYTGVAPDAQLYAIKVFGKDGSTADAVVIAGFEFAADPNGDLNPNDHLDVINMSLGGGFGQPQGLYTTAVHNLTQAGVVVVAAAGNSGAVDYIVGSPSTSDDAISVAASIDGSTRNWQFPAVVFNSKNNHDLAVKAVEGPITKSVTTIQPTSGDLVDIGQADKDLTDAQKAAVNGHVAFIQRGGGIPFADKIKRAADAGAIGVVMANNVPGDPIAMGGNGKFDIPGIMISQALAQNLTAEMKLGPVTIQFKTDRKIVTPEVVDTITDFSSKGPRSEDNLLKPEIAAPGQNIISAAMGTGVGGVQMDGTSMATPHMTGVIALLKQAHPNLSAREFKELVMETAKELKTSKGEIPLTLQGAGRVQVMSALSAPVIADPPDLSLGRVQLESVKSVSKTLTLKNLTNQPESYSITTEVDPGVTIDVQSQVTVPANGEIQVPVQFELALQDAGSFADELDARILFQQNGKTVIDVPALAIRTEATSIQAQMQNGSIQLTNTSPIGGPALPFNLLGQDARKDQPGPAQNWESRDCDLESVGYRIVKESTTSGDQDVIQFAFKLYKPLTTWHLCELSVLIDQDGDGVADQELAGVSGMSIEGVNQFNFASVLLDAKKARTIRLGFEKELSSGKADATVDYTPAVLGVGEMAPFPQSTVAVIEMPLDALAKDKDGNLNIKVAALADGGETFEQDDYLGNGMGSWMKIPANINAQPFVGLPEILAVGASAPTSLTLNKNSQAGQLVIYYPFNVQDANGQDTQSQVFNP